MAYKAEYGDSIARRPPDLTRCCEEVTRYIGGWPHYGQCARKRGFGPDQAYCKQHDPEAAAKRRAEVEAREWARYNKSRLEWAGPRFFAVLEKIANGHNDPRSLAQEAIAPYLARQKEGGEDV
jgi:hypothetical protein